jgi:general secretion pathway protein L
MNLLFLHQSRPDDVCRAWLLREDGLVELGDGTVAYFAGLHPGSACVFFLPSSLCLFASAAVSAKQLRQAEQSLAWLIEEQSGEDVENLHVIAGPAGDEETPLIAISRPALQALLDALQAAGLRPIAVLPDLFLLPRDDSDWQLAQRDGQLVLRTGPMQGAVLESDALELMLDGALLEQPAPENLTISVAIKDSALASRVESWSTQHPGVQLRMAEMPEPAAVFGAVPDWTQHPANLLQGRFAQRSRFELAGGLRIAALFIAAAFALQLLSEWVHLGYYNYQSGQVAERVVARYKTLFAEERLPTATAAAMREVEKRMRGRRNESRSDSAVLPTLTRVAGFLQGSGLSAQRVDVTGGVLTLDVQARSLGELDGFKQKLDEQGFRTEILSANAQGGLIRGRLRVEGA